jgi:hypothetical protein
MQRNEMKGKFPCEIVKNLILQFKDRTNLKTAIGIQRRLFLYNSLNTPKPKAKYNDDAQVQTHHLQSSPHLTGR